MGTYNTKQKTAILELLKENQGKHFTADDILLSLSGENMSIGKTTVYRYLEKLVSENVVRKYEISKTDASCYEYCPASEHSACLTHYHLKCTSCNKLFHINCKTLNVISEHIFSEHNFLIDKSKTVFYGLCDACSKTERNKNI